MASAPLSGGNIHPSASDTPYASEQSDLSTSLLPTAYPPDQTDLPVQVQSSPRPRIPSMPNRARGLSSASSTSAASIRRKPLPTTASPLATRLSSGEHLASTLESPEQTFARSYTIDSPTLYEFPTSLSTIPVSPSPSPLARKQGLSRGSSDQVALSSDLLTSEHHIPSTQSTSPDLSSLAIPSPARPAESSLAKHARLTTDSVLTATSPSTTNWYSDSSSSSHPVSATMSIFSSKPTPPHNITRAFSNDSYESNTTNKPLPRSPGASKFGSFFGWGGNPSPASSATFSEKSYSPVQSTHSSEHKRSPSNASKTASRIIPSAIDVPKANADATSYFGNAYLQLPSPPATTPEQVEEMEKELRDISSELAMSIRREMDLEDLVERLQAEAQNPSGPGKRTSDYFSDSGTSSVKYGEIDSRQDELDRMIRKTEQEKALMRAELTGKVQDERSRRKQLEAQIYTLKEKASQVDVVSVNSLDTNGRLRDLEATCEDLRRRLAEERQVKDNFEDLLTALKGELQSSHNERDNLRDEIVPQLRARVEGLEAQEAKHEKLTYEHSKVQQELQTLKNENTSLITAQRQHMEMQQQMKFSTIAEEVGATSTRATTRLSRSNSVANAPNSRSRPPSLSRSASVKTTESREALAERVKDVELQRDALHRALKSLLERQEHQNRENQRKIHQLEAERDRAISSSPKRLGYDKEVAKLRQEINTLRRRADEAIEQKWQCEKGLSGLKMDLDRAEQEIASLRSLLQENDILIPTARRPSAGSRPLSTPVSSESLERAYKDLRNAYSHSLDRIKNLELSSPKDEETERAMSQLEKTLAEAISERDFANQEANALREQTDSLRQMEKVHVGDEVVLADELRNSAKRVEELATQVRQQLASNSTLRQRLAETIQRGEKEQNTNAEKITFLQSKLKSLEDKVMAAQQASEDALTRHEDEIREIKESHNVQLQRMKDGMRSPRLFTPKSPMSPMFTNSARAPRLLSTISGQPMTVSEDSKMDFLRQRVVELESALAEADKEMEEVVGRMNVAQIEVMELQNEREEAVRETKRLQKMIEGEKIKTFEERFASLSS